MLQCEHDKPFSEGWALPYVIVWRDREDGEARIVDWCRDKSQVQRLLQQRGWNPGERGFMPETYCVEDVVANSAARADMTSKDSVLNEIELRRTVKEAKRRG